MNPTGWTALVLAGLFEVGFTTALKLEQKDPRYFWLFLACACISFGLLYTAIETIPLGTAYAVWTGIGAVGTTLVSRWLFKEPLNARQMALLAVVIATILLLKGTA